MGQCATGSKPGSNKNYSFEKEPTGTEALKHKNLPKLLFHANLSNVRLKQYPYVPLPKLRTKPQPSLRCDRARALPWLPKTVETRAPYW